MTLTSPARARVWRIAMLSTAAAAITVSTAELSDVRPTFQQLSIGTAYASLLLLGLTLAFAPWSVLRGRRHPSSTRLRRDTGIASACLAIIHTALGLQVHMGGRITRYFMPDQLARSGNVSAVSFLLTNYAGLVSVLVLAGLALISNDRSIRRLGTARWKRWQTLAYLAAALAVFHGVLYMIIERRTIPLALCFTALVLVVLALQISGRRHFGDLSGDVSSTADGE